MLRRRLMKSWSLTRKDTVSLVAVERQESPAEIPISKSRLLVDVMKDRLFADKNFLATGS